MRAGVARVSKRGSERLPNLGEREVLQVLGLEFAHVFREPIEEQLGTG